MDQAPNLEKVTEAVERVFKPERIGPVVLHHWHLTFTVRTDRYYRVNGTELLELAKKLEVGVECIEWWDVKVDGGGIEFSVDLDPTTPIEMPPRKVKV